MARIPKEYINTPFLHIMIQGINKELIFSKKEDINKYLQILKNAKKEINVKIVSYCVMNNHVHLLCYVNNKNDLIRFMHRTNLQYAKFYNWKYNRVGYVFRDRYKTQPILFEKHLLRCINYIHNNPVKAHICKYAGDYEFSSYNYNIFEGYTLIEQNVRKYINLTKMHDNQEDKEFHFMDTEEKQDKKDICIRKVNDYLINKNIILEQLRENTDEVFLLVKDLKENYKISYRIASEVIGVKREKLRLLMQKNSKEGE